MTNYLMTELDITLFDHDLATFKGCRGVPRVKEVPTRIADAECAYGKP